MKKTSLLVITLLSALCTAFGQMNITIQVEDLSIPIDSIRIFGYDHGKSVQLYAEAYQPSIVIKDKQSLEPGIYWIMIDSTSFLDAFIISDTKKQEFSVKINKEGSVYQNSKENTLYHEYMADIQVFDDRSAALDKEFKDAQNGGIPSYMLTVFVDSLMAKATRISTEKIAFQKQKAAETKGLLLSSVIRLNTSAPDPTREEIKTQEMYQKYVVEHYFDNFPWDDPRIFNTMLCENAIKQFNNIIYQLDRPELDTFIVAAIRASMVNKTSFNTFFDKVEKVLGSHVSPYKVEHTYIEMLKAALSYPNLEAARKVRYERELSIINKNLTGSKVPNFNIRLSNGESTSFYDIQSKYTLLYLQHPTCPTCREVRGRMANYPILNKAIADGKLKVVTVYFEQDEEIWNNYIHSPEANPSYIHGWNYDGTIEQQDLFDTRTIPFMFLLDENKNVIRKDLLVNEIEDYVSKLQ